MCGIFGLITNHQSRSSKVLMKSINTLFQLSESRGKEAAGLAMIRNKRILIYKKPVRGSILIKQPLYQKLFQNNSISAIIGHSRLATHGFQLDNKNNQPVTNGKIVCIHNGIIVNDKYLWKKILNKNSKVELDTKVLVEIITRQLKKNKSIGNAIGYAFNKLEGSASITLLFSDFPYLALATNTGSLYIAESTNPKTVVFASESYILKQYKKNREISPLNSLNKIVHVKPGAGKIIDLKTLSITSFNLITEKTTRTSQKKAKKLKAPFIVKDLSNQDKNQVSKNLWAHTVINDISKLQSHDFDWQAINKLKRCSRCILPETMPFISFDKDGVCNYCRNHKKITYKGKKALENLVEPYRSKKGKPDCLIAFSGGRDSSYGLHFLKKELGMNPIAYTYDWGMVTDLARRNEARLVGKLGVEHIIVSADITMKRDHIRKHILAWMKRPDLGMVPLFMEGDKQCEYYADDLMKKYNINLMFFCRGNEFETEEFKWGHCGITKATPKGVIHNLSLRGKLQIAAYYGWQYLTNPAYINSSIFDTLFAYFSTYVMKHDYIFLWHYLPWKERKIVSTLKKEYHWETESYTKQTWRTDDGTSAFYNYIYMAGQGFTENDTFRSNQIREDRLTRKKALELVKEENKPRYEALKWYFDILGLDGDKVLTVVDTKLPRIY